MLHRSCRLAHKWSGGTLPNPAADADLPIWRLDERRPDVRAPEVHEVRKLLATAEAEDLRFGCFLRLLATTGMREERLVPSAGPTSTSSPLGPRR